MVTEHIPKLTIFQSQNGLILTRNLSVFVSPATEISIPKWSDFNNANGLAPLNPIIISIPKWSDFNNHPISI